MDDLISRRAAIGVLRNRWMKTINYEGVGEDIAEECEIYLKTLPSAQSEIVRCKNCKHWIPYDWMFSEVWQSKNIADYPEDEIGCKFCDMAMKADDFCSRAERREE